MAGEWIKVQTSTARKPEVMRLARMLGISRREMIGTLIDFWVWLDSSTVDGVVDGVGGHEVDEVMSCPGFSTGLAAVGWMQIDDENFRIVVPNFERHNGESAKKRILKNERQARWRSKTVDVSVDAKTSSREEKRREEKDQTLMSESPSATTDVLPLQVDKAKPSKLRAEAEDLLSFLNEKTARHFRPTDTTLRPLMARLKEGFSAAECRAVIARKCREWKGGDMAPYLRPETLFNASKFAQYVGEVPPEVSSGA